MAMGVGVTLKMSVVKHWGVCWGRCMSVGMNLEVDFGECLGMTQAFPLLTPSSHPHEHGLHDTRPDPVSHPPSHHGPLLPASLPPP